LLLIELCQAVECFIEGNDVEILTGRKQIGFVE